MSRSTVSRTAPAGSREKRERKMATKRYEIGGLVCRMTPKQARAWNEGNVSARTMIGATVHLPGSMSEGNGEVFALWAFIERIHPEIYHDQMDGMPANPVKENECPRS